MKYTVSYAAQRGPAKCVKALKDSREFLGSENFDSVVDNLASLAPWEGMRANSVFAICFLLPIEGYPLRALWALARCKRNNTSAFDALMEEVLYA